MNPLAHLQVWYLESSVGQFFDFWLTRGSHDWRIPENLVEERIEKLCFTPQEQDAPLIREEDLVALIRLLRNSEYQLSTSQTRILADTLPRIYVSTIPSGPVPGVEGEEPRLRLNSTFLFREALEMLLTRSAKLNPSQLTTIMDWLPKQQVIPSSRSLTELIARIKQVPGEEQEAMLERFMRCFLKAHYMNSETSQDVTNALEALDHTPDSFFDNPNIHRVIREVIHEATPEKQLKGAGTSSSWASPPPILVRPSLGVMPVLLEKVPAEVRHTLFRDLARLSPEDTLKLVRQRLHREQQVLTEDLAPLLICDQKEVRKKAFRMLQATRQGPEDSRSTRPISSDECSPSQTPSTESRGQGAKSQAR